MPFQPSDRLKRLPPYLFSEMERKKNALAAQGKDIINLGIGDPDQPPPERIRNALTAHLNDGGVHQYSPSQGIDEFRAAVARWFWRRYSVQIDPAREVCLGVGSKELIAHLPLALTNPGDLVLIPEPGYPPYRSGTLFALCEPYVVPLRTSNGFLPDLDAIPADVARRAKVLFINYPNNPTGATAGRDFFQRCIDFARPYGTLIVSDEAYAELYYEERPLSFLELSGSKETGIVVHSMTKTFSMAGWRIAWVAGNPEVVEILRSFKANCDSGQFMGFQKAVAEILDHGEADMAAIRRMYQGRRDVLVNALRRIGWEIPNPKATFYVWFRVPNRMNSIEFADHLLENAHVVVTPGAGFGGYGEGFVRIALTVPEDRLREACERLARLRV